MTNLECYKFEDQIREAKSIRQITFILHEAGKTRDLASVQGSAFWRALTIAGYEKAAELTAKNYEELNGVIRSQDFSRKNWI